MLLGGGSNGVLKYSNGLITQWGRAPVRSGTANQIITLNLAMSSTDYNIQISSTDVDRGDYATQNANTYGCEHGFGRLTKTSFAFGLQAGYGNSQYCTWLVTGY